MIATLDVFRSFVKYLIDALPSESVRLRLFDDEFGGSEAQEVNYINVMISSSKPSVFGGVPERMSMDCLVQLVYDSSERLFSVLDIIWAILNTGVCKVYDFSTDSTGAVTDKIISWDRKQALEFNDMEAVGYSCWVSTFELRFRI